MVYSRLHRWIPSRNEKHSINGKWVGLRDAAGFCTLLRIPSYLPCGPLTHAFTGSTPHRFANEGRELGREYRDSGPGSHRKGNSARQGKSYKPAIDPHPPTFCQWLDERQRRQLRRPIDDREHLRWSSILDVAYGPNEAGVAPPTGGELKGKAEICQTPCRGVQVSPGAALEGCGASCSVEACECQCFCVVRVGVGSSRQGRT